MEKKTIVARAEVLPGKEQEFISKAEPLIQGTRAEEGNISYNLYQNPSNPTAFIFYEEYKDQNAISVERKFTEFHFSNVERYSRCLLVERKNLLSCSMNISARL